MGRSAGSQHNAALARPAFTAGKPAGMVLDPGEVFRAGYRWNTRGTQGTTGRQYQLLGPQHHRFAGPFNCYGPFLGGFVVGGLAANGRRPVVQCHDLGVHLQPIAHLVLVGKDGPVVRKGQVGQMVKPDRIMQIE